MARFLVLAALFINLHQPAVGAEAERASYPGGLILRGVDGRDLSSQALTGKTTILQFYASWCGGCGAVMADLLPVVNGRSGAAQLIPVSVDESMAEAGAYFARQSEPVKALRRSAVLDAEAGLARALGIGAVPATVVIASDGSVLTVVTGHPDQAALDRIRGLLAH